MLRNAVEKKTFWQPIEMRGNVDCKEIKENSLAKILNAECAEIKVQLFDTNPMIAYRLHFKISTSNMETMFGRYNGLEVVEYFVHTDITFNIH